MQTLPLFLSGYRIQVTGGTGKFKDLRGSGVYKGKTTQKGSQVNWEVVIEN
jgi:hypothetical protein